MAAGPTTHRPRILLLGALVGLGPFTIDAYLPAFPSVAAELGTTAAAVQFTLTSTTLGFALGQLFAGSLSDRFGRRGPLVTATAIHVVASVAVLLSTSIVEVVAARLAQGVGAAGGAVIAFAIARDAFKGTELVRALGSLALFSGLAPVIAPIIGGQLLLVTSWRGVFGFLAGLGLVTVLLTAALMPETRPRSRRARERLGTWWSYRLLFHDPVYLAWVCAGAMQFAAFFTYISNASDLFQGDYGTSPQTFGLLFGINGVGLAIGAQVSSRLARRTDRRRLVVVAQIALGCAAGATVCAGVARLPLVPAAVMLFVFALSYGFALPCVQSLVLERLPQIAGTAASVMGALNFTTGGLMAAIVGLVGVSATTLGVAQLLLVGVAVALFRVGQHTAQSADQLGNGHTGEMERR